MSLRTVLLTRTSRPSGAQMAWRLIQAGYFPVAVLVEKRGRMLQQKKESLLLKISRMGIPFIWKRVLEAAQIKKQYYLRKILKDRYREKSFLSIG